MDKQFAVYAYWPDWLWPPDQKPYDVVNHGLHEISKYHKGDYWDSPNDPSPTRGERERHENFLGWTDQPEDKWCEEEHETWDNMARSWILAQHEERESRSKSKKSQLSDM